jgi:hypothetical protein
MNRDVPPTFGLVTALPEEFHAMRALLGDPADTRVLGDRAGYVAATLPSLDERRPHAVILTLTADIGTHAAADACRSLVAAFPSVNAVVMAGIAAGVPNPAARTGTSGSVMSSSRREGSWTTGMSCREFTGTTCASPSRGRQSCSTGPTGCCTPGSTRASGRGKPAWTRPAAPS